MMELRLLNGLIKVKVLGMQREDGGEWFPVVRSAADAFGIVTNQNWYVTQTVPGNEGFTEYRRREDGYLFRYYGVFE